MAKQTYGIIGHPVKHSLSPAMQSAAFADLGIEAEYRLFDVEPSKLNEFLDDLSANGISGVNITVPHKVAAKNYLERSGGVVNPHAAMLGAINTVKVRDGKLYGFNTDGPGFYRSLVEDLKFEPEGKDIFVIGAGGAASAITMYLGNGPKRIHVFDVDSAKAISLKAHFGNFFDPSKLDIVDAGNIKRSIDESQLLINATPLGMNLRDPDPIDLDFLHPGLYVYDIVYNVPGTKLVEHATRQKLHAVTGLGMLLYQGAIAFEIWTGMKAPIDVMRKALKSSLVTGRS